MLQCPGVVHIVAKLVQYLSNKFKSTIGYRDRFFFFEDIDISIWDKKPLIVINKIEKQHGQAKFTTTGDKR